MNLNCHPLNYLFLSTLYFSQHSLLSTLSPFYALSSLFSLCYRSLGVHISKVRSLTLDDLDPEEYKLLKRIGESTILF